MKKILLSGFVIISFVLYSLRTSSQQKEVATEPVKELVITPTPSSSGATPVTTGTLKDGEYTGSAEDVFYGTIQVKATISGGSISDIEFLQYPHDQDTSIQINTAMMPILKQEAISAQSTKVDIVSGATDSSEGFKKSLAAALLKAK